MPVLLVVPGAPPDCVAVNETLVGGTAVSLYTATVCEAVVTLKVPKFAMLTVTFPAVVTPDKAIVHVVPEPDNVPFVTTPVPFVMVMSLALKPVTAELNVSTIPVLSAVPDVPPVCVAVNVTFVGGTDVSLYTVTV
jgi:hypothetical protein